MIQCAFENGNNASLRHVTIGIIAENVKGEILLVKRAPNIFRGNKYTIPGGFLDRDESTEKGAPRELYEETGLRGEIRFLFRINDSPLRPKEDRQNVDFIYIAKIIGAGIAKEDKETIEIKWFTKEQLPPDDDFAFDHRASIMRYFEYIEKPFALPILG